MEGIADPCTLLYILLSSPDVCFPDFNCVVCKVVIFKKEGNVILIVLFILALNFLLIFTVSLHALKTCHSYPFAKNNFSKRPQPVFLFRAWRKPIL